MNKISKKDLFPGQRIKNVPSLLKEKSLSAGNYIFVFLKWVLLAVIVGIIGGCIGTAFNICVTYASNIRQAHSWLIYLLPLGGLMIVLSYKISRVQMKIGTDQVIDSIRTNKRVPILLVPLIFMATIITHLFGGSSGREGAALQIGGGIGNHMGRLFHLDEKDARLVTLCGMSAVFSALFGTPLTATIFAIEVVSIGIIHYSALVPCLTASLTAKAISDYFSSGELGFTLAAVPKINLINILKVTAIAAVCAAVSIVFCLALHYTQRIFKKLLKNEFVRIFAGGVIVVLLTLAVGNKNYNGTGMDIIRLAVLSGEANWYDFLLKIVFTAVTIGCGFKGGEIVPTFFIGSTLGCVIGAALGFNPGTAAAIGLIAMFCSVMNCPVASIILSVELFGARGIIYFAVACAVSYLLSGYYGLYTGQKIIYSKTKAEFIDKNTK